MRLLEYFSRHVAYPLWDLRDKSVRLKEYRSLMRQQWDKSEARSQRQLDRLNAIVQYAVKNVPYYREVIGGAGNYPEFKDISELSRLPILTKTDIRKNTDRIISDEFDKERLVSAKTGGSTGTSLKVFFDEECQQRRNAAAMMSDSWAGWRPGMEVAGLWGSPAVAKTFKAIVRNRLHDRVFYLDTMNLSPDTMLEFNEEILCRKPGALFGHAHSIYEFARFVEESALRVHRFEAIVATSMMLLLPHRQLIERVFGVRVTNRYGCEEVGLIACECEVHDGLHINEEHLVVEFLDYQGRAALPNEPARLVVTDLNNFGMPLIRYEVGDVAELMLGHCTCGRGSRRIRKLVGRTADYLKRKDGSLVSGISMVEKTLTAITGIEQMQIIQQELQRFKVLVVESAEPDNQWKKHLEASIGATFGYECTITIQVVPQLPKTARGKSIFAICHV